MLYTKKIRNKRFSGDIKIIDRLPIDTQATLLIVSVRNSDYLISLSGKQLTVIEKYSCSK